MDAGLAAGLACLAWLFIRARGTETTTAGVILRASVASVASLARLVAMVAGSFALAEFALSAIGPPPGWLISLLLLIERWLLAVRHAVETVAGDWQLLGLWLLLVGAAIVLGAVRVAPFASGLRRWGPRLRLVGTSLAIVTAFSLFGTGIEERGGELRARILADAEVTTRGFEAAQQAVDRAVARAAVEEIANLASSCDGTESSDDGPCAFLLPLDRLWGTARLEQEATSRRSGGPTIGGPVAGLPTVDAALRQIGPSSMLVRDARAQPPQPVGWHRVTVTDPLDRMARREGPDGNSEVIQLTAWTADKGRAVHAAAASTPRSASEVAEFAAGALFTGATSVAAGEAGGLLLDAVSLIVHPVAAEVVKAALAAISRDAMDRVLAGSQVEMVLQDARARAREQARSFAGSLSGAARSLKARVAIVLSDLDAAVSARDHVMLATLNQFAGAREPALGFAHPAVASAARQVLARLAQAAPQWRSGDAVDAVAALTRPGGSTAERAASLADLEQRHLGTSRFSIAVDGIARQAAESDGPGRWAEMRRDIARIVDRGEMRVPPEKLARARVALEDWRRAARGTARRAVLDGVSLDWESVFVAHLRGSPEMQALWGFAVIGLDRRPGVFDAAVREGAERFWERNRREWRSASPKAVMEALGLSERTASLDWQDLSRDQQWSEIRRVVIDLRVSSGPKPYMGLELYLRERGGLSPDEVRRMTDNPAFNRAVDAICPV